MFSAAAHQLQWRDYLILSLAFLDFKVWLHSEQFSSIPLDHVPSAQPSLHLIPSMPWCYPSNFFVAFLCFSYQVHCPALLSFLGCFVIWLHVLHMSASSFWYLSEALWYSQFLAGLTHWFYAPEVIGRVLYHRSLT